MILHIYNGTLSDSNNYIMIDTDSVSLKEAMTYLALYIHSFLVQSRKHKDWFSDYYESMSSDWLICNPRTKREIYLEKALDNFKFNNISLLSKLIHLTLIRDTFGSGFRKLIYDNN